MRSRGVPRSWGERLVQEAVAAGRLVLSEDGRRASLAGPGPAPAPVAPELALPWSCTILGGPRTKKNHGQRHWAGGGLKKDGTPGKRHLAALPSKAFLAWQEQALPQLQQAVRGYSPARRDVWVRALVYRDALYRGDLNGYMQAIGDVLQAAGVLGDDFHIESWDGTRRLLDRDLPRVELLVRPFDG